MGKTDSGVLLTSSGAMVGVAIRVHPNPYFLFLCLGLRCTRRGMGDVAGGNCTGNGR